VALDPQLQSTLAAHIKYFRDLGVSDFYRRGEPLPAEETSAVSQTVTAPATKSLPPIFIEIPSEMPRAATAVRPLVPSPTLPVLASAPIAPELRASALQAIRDEI
jgi:uracil-DNA glycosylase